MHMDLRIKTTLENFHIQMGFILKCTGKDFGQCVNILDFHLQKKAMSDINIY